MKANITRLKRKANKISLKVKLSGMSDNDVASYLRLNGDGFLFSAEWKALRLLAIDKYGLICLCCGRENSRQHPINIDHIKPRKYFPELALDIDNLQPLCGPCNKRKGNKSISYRLNISAKKIR
jgi:5-methylcytosine-specific restriction endonuclease McrA